MENKNVNLKTEDKGYIEIEVKELIDWNEPNGEGCIVSDKITKEGYKVGYMYREDPTPNMPDSGWRFLVGDENEDYMNDSNNHHVFAINTLCNYDPSVIPYLNSKIGSAYIRVEGNKFELDDGSKAIVIEKQNEK